jgi:hypothetical protein
MSHRLLLSAVIAISLVSAAAFGADASITIESPRRAFYRGETIDLRLRVTGVDSGTVSANLDDVIHAHAALDGEAVMLRLPTQAVRCGEYQLTVALRDGEQTIATTARAYTIAMRPNPHRLMVWLWGGGGSTFYREHGFTSWSGLYWNSLDDNLDAARKTLDDGLVAGGDCLLRPNGGLRDLLNETFDDPDALYEGLHGWYTTRVAEGKVKPLPNPFHPQVARRQNEANARLMQLARDYPQIRTAFFNTEVVDTMAVNRNQAGRQLMQDMLGFTEDDIGEPQYVAEGVIADDDRGYLFHKFAYQHGKGITLANQRTAEMIDRYRRDIITISDPYREVALYDLYPGVDAIETWTYTNPDPKLMLYIETLRTACKPTGQIPLSVVTMLNYPGQLDTSDEWMLMGPGRVAVTSWINLSRAPRIVGYYYSSACPPPGKPGDHRVPYETSAMIKQLSEQVYEPFGPMITQLDVEPRRIAVLSSESSRLYGKSPRLSGHYGNMQIYHFYTVLAMAHLQADVVFDETIERFGLDDYDVLVLPKCDVLTETVYNEIQRFAERGGTIIADQYLGPQLPGAITFDFDFTYRDKVSANAIAENKAYVAWDDQLQPDVAELKDVEGVTALDDQRIMESYAAQMRQRLAGVVDPDVSASAPTVLLNLLEHGDVKYLVVVNDKRTYDERLREYQSVLGQIEPQTATIQLHRADLRDRVAYDMLSRELLDVTDGAIEVQLTELGGTIIALHSRAIGEMSIQTPARVAPGDTATLRVMLDARDGLQPMEVTITAPGGARSSYSGYHCATRGILDLPFVAALNDEPGTWTVEARDLTAGRTAQSTFVIDQ